MAPGFLTALDLAALGAALDREPVVRAGEEIPADGGETPEAPSGADAAQHEAGGRSGTAIEEGLRRFVAWYASRGAAR